MRNIIFAEMKTAYLWDNAYFSAEKKTYLRRYNIIRKKRN